MKRIVLAAVLLTLLAAPALAQAPGTMSYQGVLADGSGNLVPDGPYDLIFNLYDVAVAGGALWAEPHPGVMVTDGGFSVILGLSVPLNLTFDTTYYLGIEVNGGAELIPRVRLAASPYALSLRLPYSQAVPSDSPLLFLHNTGTGAEIVADGRLDVGSTFSSGDLKVFRAASATNVVNLFASAGGGNAQCYDELGNLITSTSPDLDGEGGVLAVYRTTAAAGFSVDGNFAGTSEPRVAVSGSARSVVFSPGSSGNGSVSLPTDAISATETLDEPGAASTNADAQLVMPAVVTTLLSRSLTVPADGYVLAIGSGQVNAVHTNGVASTSNFGVSDAAGALPGTQDFAFTLPSALPSGTFNVPVTVHGLFSVTAGLHTFYFLGDEVSGDWSVNDRQLTLLFIPTAYGTVTPTLAAAATADEGTRPASFGLTAADIGAEQGEAQAFNSTRILRELDEMRGKVDQLQRELRQQAADQQRAAAAGRRK